MTVELAIGMVTVMIMVAMIVGVGGVSRASIAAEAAALDAARLAARGESRSVIAERVVASAGESATFVVAGDAVVSATVTVPVQVVGLGIPAVVVTGTASAMRES